MQGAKRKTGSPVPAAAGVPARCNNSLVTATSSPIIDLLDSDFYVDGPYQTYAWMRENAPLYWDSINELWGVSRYADVVEIEKRKDVFINSDQRKGGTGPTSRPTRPSSASTTPSTTFGATWYPVGSRPRR